MVKIPIKTVTLFIFLTSVNGISQTKNSDSLFLFKKHLVSLMLPNSNIFWNTTKTSFQSNNATLILFEQQLLLPGKKIPNPWEIEKIKDSVNKRLVKGKMDADKWRCTQPDPKMIAAKKAAEEQFLKKSNN